MLVLLGIGLVAGVVTALSPCVLPVLPILLAGGASGRKPLRIVAGIVSAFTVFTLFAARLLDALALPADLLRNIALALLFVMAAALLVPRFAEWLERPLAPLTRHRAGGGGFLLGASLGLVFVPCAGPVLAAVTAIAASNDVGLRALALTFAYAVGAAIPMLLVIVGGRSAAARLRAYAPRVRFVSGVLVAVAALGIALHVDERFQTALPGYTDALRRPRREVGAGRAPARDASRRRLEVAHAATNGLEDYGVAPRSARGPLVQHPAADASVAPRPRGARRLLDVFVHQLPADASAPEGVGRGLPQSRADDHRRAHARVRVRARRGNVEAAVKRLGIRYPVVQDNEFGTWTAYANQYWPAKYLIDRAGHVRFVHFGEGWYGKTEALIRRCSASEPAAPTEVPDTTPVGLRTPESYLGYERLARYEGSTLHPGPDSAYHLPVEPVAERARLRRPVARRGRADRRRPGARLRLHFYARNVYLVLGGRGRVDVLVNGRRTRTVAVDSYRLYTLRSGSLADAMLELQPPPASRPTRSRSARRLRAAARAASSPLVLLALA